MRISRRKLFIAGLAVAVALGVGTVGIVVGASETTFELTTTTSERQAGRHHRKEHLSRRERRERFEHLYPGAKRCKNEGDEPVAQREIRTMPAEMLGPRSATDTPSGVLWPVRNGWVAGDCRRVTWVWAGGGGLDANRYRSQGKLVIRRSGGNLSSLRSYVTVDVRDSGPLKIVNAPLGPDVVTSAQSGQLPFTSRRGITGALDLSTDSVTLSTGEMIEGQHP
jgi:hypothetical protein